MRAWRVSAVPCAWVIELAGQWYAVLGRRNGWSARQLVHVEPPWEPEPDEVTALLAWVVGVPGSERPDLDLLVALGDEAIYLRQEADAMPPADAYPPLGWWRGSAVECEQAAAALRARWDRQDGREARPPLPRVVAEALAVGAGATETT